MLGALSLAVALWLAFAPGVAWASALRAERWTAGLSLAPLLLVLTLLALDGLGAPLRPATIAPALALVAALAWPARLLLDRRWPAPAPPARVRAPGWGLALPVLAVALLLARATLQPLTGIDVEFRWGALAEQVIRQGSLSFYPPASADDFLLYHWPDSIPPLVSATYAWVWLCLGEVSPRATAPLVAGQAGLLVALVWRLAGRLEGPRAGALAASVVAVTALVWRSIAIGQETGWTAISLVAATLAVAEARPGFDPRAMLLAGALAAVGGVSREYGLAFAPCLAWVAWRRGQRGAGVALLLGAAAALAAPWYLRTWVRTGNPLFDLELAGLFPTLPAHQALVAERARGNALGGAALVAAAWSLGRDAGLAVGAGLLGLALAPRSRLALAPAALVAALWAWSVRYTDGGVFYSLRVLCPTVALLAVPAGSLLARTTELGRAGQAAAAGLLAASAVWMVASALAFPLLPDMIPPGAWGRVATRGLPMLASQAQLAEGPLLETIPPGAALLTADCFAATVLRRAGRRAIPPWSPEVAFLCDPDLPPAEGIARLQALGVVAVTALPAHDAPLARRWPAWAALVALPRRALTPGFVIYPLPPDGR